MSDEPSNCPSAVPNDPNVNASVPSGWKTWMRARPSSATTMRPSEATATAYGKSNSPSPTPCDPKACAKVPLGWKTWMRWLP